MTPDVITMDRRLLYVLALFEAGMSLLATLGGTLFMGADPLYLAVGTAVATLYIVAGLAALRGRRWGLLTLAICEGVRLAGFGLSELIGLLPAVQLTLTGATLVDSFVLPAIVAIMAATQFIGSAAVAVPVALPPTRIQPIEELVG